HVRAGNGTGGFGADTRYTVADNSVALVTADVNNDGKADLAGAGQMNRVCVLLGAGGGVFAPPPSLAVGTFPGSIAGGDLNADGAADAVVGIESNNTAAVMLG